jgi:hypothetical protein
MILPAVRERLESVLRHPSMEAALAALRSGGQLVSISGLHDVAKALVAAYVTHELRRPAFFVAESNRRAEALADTLRFFSTIFPSAMGGVATLPAFDTLPWQSQSPHADILERRAATLFRLTDGQVSLLVAPISAATKIRTSIFRLPAPSPPILKYLSKNCSRTSAPWATREPRWSRCRANSPCGAASSTFFPRNRRAPCASNS